MMMSRKQILEHAIPRPTPFEMLKIFCQEVINDCKDMRVNVSLLRMYAQDVLDEMGEEE
jgi:hypothetical protein